MVRLVIFIMCLLSTTSAFADTAGVEDSVPQKLNLNGSVRAGYFSSSRKLDGQENLGTASVWLKLSPDIGSNASLMVEGWVRNDESLTGNSKVMLREGYLNYSAGDADFRIGKQIIAWGRADRLNPTDNLTPYNYTLLTSENDDQRLGTAAVKMTYHFHDTSLTGIWIPSFTPNVFPLAAPPGTYFTEQSPRSNQVALKLDRSGGAVDWSVSYFSGLDLNPDFGIGATGSSGTNLILKHNRIRVLGMDAATVVGRYGLRAEAAYSWTSNTGPNDSLVKKSFIYVVAGGDRTIFNNLNINVQYYFHHVTDYQDPHTIANSLLRTLAIQAAILSQQLDRFEHGVSIRVSNNWLNETLKGEIAGLYSLTHGDYVLKPKLVYAFNDQLTGTLGLDIYRGGADTFYGQLRGISSIFVEMKSSF